MHNTSMASATRVNWPEQHSLCIPGLQESCGAGANTLLFLHNCLGSWIAAVKHHEENYIHCWHLCFCFRALMRQFTQPWNKTTRLVDGLDLLSLCLHLSNLFFI